MQRGIMRTKARLLRLEMAERNKIPEIDKENCIYCANLISIFCSLFIKKENYYVTEILTKVVNM